MPLRIRFDPGYAAVLLAGLLVGSGPAVAETGKAAQQRQQQAQILDSFGGVYDGAQAAYVTRIGEKVAVAAGMGGRCTFTLVNSDVINAFAAPPGCYIYVTRGLLAILNSEAELAGVLGHEVGHVTAKHANRQRNTQVLGGLAAVLVGAVSKSDQLGQLAGQVAQLGVLSYSRGQEYEADSLAVKYLPLAGYPADGISRALAGLQRQDDFSLRTAGDTAGQVIPVWARTHPLTGDRIARATRAAAAADGVARSPSNEAAFLSAVDGLVYGDDPSQGFVRGAVFAHTGLRIGFTAPRGFSVINGASAVTVNGPKGLRGQLSAGKYANGRLEDFAGVVIRNALGEGGGNIGQPQRTTINGLETVFLPARATSQGQSVDVSAVVYDLGNGDTYQFVTIAPAGQSATFDTMYASFHRLTDAEAARYKARRIEVVGVRPADTAQSLSSRMSTDVDKLGLFQMLNDVKPVEALASGRRVKLVTEVRK